MVWGDVVAADELSLMNSKHNRQVKTKHMVAVYR